MSFDRARLEYVAPTLEKHPYAQVTGFSLPVGGDVLPEEESL